MRVIVELRRNEDGAMVGIDTWGDVMNVGYDAETNSVTISGSDGSGLRQKTYGSGQYAAVTMFPGGPDDSSLWPADAKRIA